MNDRQVRISIMVRIAALACLLVAATSLMITLSTEYRFNRTLATERSMRFRFLARSLSYGLHDTLASPAARGRVREVVAKALQRVLSEDQSFVACEVFAAGRKSPVFSFFDSDRLRPGESVRWESAPVHSGRLRIGAVRIGYVDRDIHEAERTRQLLMIGSTIASMITVYIVDNDYFQVENLTKNLARQDPDILYCRLTDVKGIPIFSYKYDSYSRLLPKNVEKAALSVSALQPVLIQRPKLPGPEMVEASLLIRDGNRNVAVLRIGYSLARIQDSLRRERLHLTGLTALLILAALLTAVLMSRSVSEPIRRLTRSARLAAGQSDPQGNLAETERLIRDSIDAFENGTASLRNRRDEAGDLARSFATLLSSLDQRLTEIKNLYRQMSQADRLYAMAQLAGGIAHEINNPLTIISTYVQMILRRQDIDPEIREEMGIIREEINRIASRIRELLSFARDVKTDRIPTDLHELLRHVLSLTRYQMKTHHVELDEHFAPDPSPMVTADREKLRQVFLNLILNAVQAMPGGGRLTVRTGIGRGEVLIDIEDTGIGIPEDVLNRIFDPFFTTKKPGEGTGLGLSVSHGIVTEHGGGIEATSRPGEGSRFRVTLPLLDDTADPDPPGSAP